MMKEVQHPVNNEASDLRFPLLVDPRSREDTGRRRDHPTSIRLPARRSSLDLHSLDRLTMMASNDDDMEERVVDAEGIRDLLSSEYSSSARRIIRSSEHHHGGGSGGEVPSNISNNESFEESSQDQETKEEPSKSNYDSSKK